MNDFIKMPSIPFTVTHKMVEQFAALTGDHSSLHLDPEFGRRTIFGSNIVHGMLSFAFVAALDLPAQGSFRRMNARFARPVFAGDSLLLEALSTEAARSTLVELAVRKSDGTVVANGGLEIGELIRAEGAGVATRCQPDPRKIPITPLEEQDLRPGDINKGDTSEFPFVVCAQHAETLEEILKDGFASRGAVDNNKRRANNLLGAFMISPFIGMCIPGRLGLLTNFEIIFTHPLQSNVRYDFRGRVLFKSISASTIVEEFSIHESDTAREMAHGKVTSKINYVDEPALAVGPASTSTSPATPAL